MITHLQKPRELVAPGTCLCRDPIKMGVPSDSCAEPVLLKALILAATDDFFVPLRFARPTPSTEARSEAASSVVSKQRIARVRYVA
jgi:hypothetical protein